LFAALFSVVTSFAAQAQTILVDADKVSCPTATFSAIQPAIDSASPGETVRVCKGVYHEQLIISKSISVLGDPSAELIPTAMTADATGATVADQIAAAIVVKKSDGCDCRWVLHRRIQQRNPGVCAAADRHPGKGCFGDHPE
jgi:pectin methylesterase-like acyl-CoA thioesterase